MGERSPGGTRARGRASRRGHRWSRASLLGPGWACYRRLGVGLGGVNALARLREAEANLVGGRAGVGGFLEAVEDQSFQRRANRAVELPGRGRLFRDVLAGDLYRGTGERRLPHRRVVEGRAQRVDVALLGNLFPPQLL